jgi:hypothetical protein
MQNCNNIFVEKYVHHRPGLQLFRTIEIDKPTSQHALRPKRQMKCARLYKPLIRKLVIVSCDRKWPCNLLLSFLLKIRAGNIHNEFMTGNQI